MPHRFQLLRAPLRVASIALFVSGHVFGQAPPFVHTQVAAPAGTPITLDGMLVANNLPATSWFEWGTSTNYGSIAEVADTFSDTRVHRVSAPISGLANGVIYHFRLVGSNSAGVVYGMDHVFRVEAAYGKLAAWGANDSGQCTIPSGISNLVALVGTYSGSI